MWLHTDTTPAAITRDLEQMKAKGIAGFLLYDAGAGHASREYQYKTILVGKEFQYVRADDCTNAYDTPIPAKPLATWSPRWRELIRYVAKESARLDLKFCLTMGLSAVSGPITEEYGNQKLIWTEKAVSGPATFDGILPETPSVNAPEGANQPPTPHYRRDVAVVAIPDTTDFPASQVIDLTSKMDASGHLHWDVPEGKWKILRYFQVPTGTRNSWGYFTDGLSAEALDKTWEVTMAPLLKEMSPEERKGIIGVEEDSWEGGATAWTKNFLEEFKQRRGYDLTPCLPVLAGVKMADEATRQRIHRDYDLTISDLMAENNYGHLQKLCQENGLMFYSEAAGPHLVQSDLLKNISRVDVAMAEFWYPSAHRRTPEDRFFARVAANATHIYGLSPINMDEAFTSMGPEWEETPFTMKPVADQAFCDGINRICFHNFSHSPSLTAKPGYVYLPGTHYEPGITWWEQTPAFNTYLARCSFLLQQGKFVADAIFYHGDNIGKGEPMKIIPPTLGEGYDHDNCNSEVLLKRMGVRDGHIVLPDGMSYCVMVLPDQQPMPLEDLKKVAALVEAGATVVGPPPTGISGMSAGSDGEKVFDALTARLWGGMDGTNVTSKKLGAGRLVWGQTARQVLEGADAPPDFEAKGVSNDGTIDWIHRQAGDAEIYYVASRWEHPEKIDCAFRVAGKQPELWNPVTGEIRDATAFHQEAGRCVVPLDFDPCGSVFVIFRKPIPATLSGKAPSNYPATRLLTALSGAWTVNFDPKWGGPEKVVFDTLTDWTNRPEAGIKFYSGTAVYHKKFDLMLPSRGGARILLDLGEVHEVASVRLNGHNLGVVWTKPARVDITEAVKDSDNDLEVTVVNLWPNRLIGDESLPKESRFTETNMHKFGPASPLLPSGLIGPVRLFAEEMNFSKAQ